MKASMTGRDLILDPEEGIRPFTIKPLSARRGKALTERFIAGTHGELSVATMESVFIEALGPGNYSRGSGYVVERWDIPRGDATAEPILIETYVGEERTQHVDTLPRHDPVYVARDSRDDEPDVEGEALTQSDLEFLALAAFYWHTVVGMEAVNLFVEGGGTTAAQGKVTALLTMRGVLSPSPNLSRRATELSQQTGTSSRTSGTAHTSGSVPLPAVKAPQDRKSKGKGKRRSAASGGRSGR